MKPPSVRLEMVAARLLIPKSEIFARGQSVVLDSKVISLEDQIRKDFLFCPAVEAPPIEASSMDICNEY